MKNNKRYCVCQSSFAGKFCSLSCSTPNICPNNGIFTLEIEKCRVINNQIICYKDVTSAPGYVTKFKHSTEMRLENTNITKDLQTLITSKTTKTTIKITKKTKSTIKETTTNIPHIYAILDQQEHKVKFLIIENFKN